MMFEYHWLPTLVTLRPPYPVIKAYQLPLIQCCFIAMCVSVGNYYRPGAQCDLVWAWAICSQVGI